MKYSISQTEVSATDTEAGWNWYVSLDGKTLAQGREMFGVPPKRLPTCR